MSFRMTRGRPMAGELHRLIDRQFEAAVERCRSDRPGSATGARQRVKKVKAILRLVHSVLGTEAHRINRSLKAVNHALGALTDAERVVATLDVFDDCDLRRLSPAILKKLRTHLRARGADAERHAAFADVRGRAAHALERLRIEARRWDLTGCTPATITAEIRSAHAASRKARNHALAYPSIPGYHLWWRRTKAERYMLQLVGDRCGHKMIDDEKRLQALESCLGHLHDLNVLAEVVIEDSPLTRKQTADFLRALRELKRPLIKKSRTFGRALNSRPRELERRLRALWDSADQPPHPAAAPCPVSA